MTNLVEGNHIGEFLLSEADGTLSRDKITIVANAPSFDSGQLLGKITASGKYAAYSSGASDGTQTVAAILYWPTVTSTSDQPASAITRLAEVDSQKLSSVNSTIRTQLLALNIAVRD